MVTVTAEIYDVLPAGRLLLESISRRVVLPDKTVATPVPKALSVACLLKVTTTDGGAVSPEPAGVQTTENE